MPGALPHLAAGITMFIIGRYYYKNYFDGDNRTKERLFLLLVCLLFSFIPDFFMIIYYITHIFPFCSFIPYHNLTNFILIPIAIISILLLKYEFNTMREPVWIMGFWSIILHVSMDLFIQETSIWI